MTGKKWFEESLRILSGSRIAFLALLAAGGYFLWTEHQAHLRSALPYLVFLLCPLMHIFMHRGHGGGRPGNDPHRHDNH